MKTFVIILVLAVILIGGYRVWGRGGAPETINNNQNVPAQNNATTTPATSTPSTATSTGSNSGIAPMYTLAQVSTHSTSKDCWTTIKGSVYNLTSWISKHPGGEQAILSICGKDGTATFEGQHGGQSRPENILATFFIGTLKK